MYLLTRYVYYLVNHTLLPHPFVTHAYIIFFSLQVALHMRAIRTFQDLTGTVRKNGEEWLIKMEEADAHIPDVYEEVKCVIHDVYTCAHKYIHYVHVGTCDCTCIHKHLCLVSDRLSLSIFMYSIGTGSICLLNIFQVVGIVNITTLSNRQYCVILDPVGADGKPQLGQKKLIKGERSFFLRPGEKLEKGIQNVYVLGEDEGLILKANEAFVDTETVSI